MPHEWTPSLLQLLLSVGSAALFVIAAWFNIKNRIALLEEANKTLKEMMRTILNDLNVRESLLHDMDKKLAVTIEKLETVKADTGELKQKMAELSFSQRTLRET